MKLYLEMFIVFFKIGCLAFGGGYAVIGLLQKEIVELKQWVDNDELTDIMAISQTLPGIIFVNSATMIGYRKKGILGATVATVSSVMPTFFLILILTFVIWGVTDNPIVHKAFTGILLGVTALILNSVKKTWKTAVKHYPDIILAVTATVLLLFTGLNVVLILLLMAGLGFAKNLYALKKEAEKLEAR
ncbi:chromate transport protein ChrA [Desulfosporosinus orientis DSM 765]|uniref:Chromate transport protein ChrA n=1 Tax=Desulfosporosinus orientis (strain ATCC 19365 / DSM 765 / NCIMB 8382 / VKM B-1628 / Singapore I) TaxID=768706 RepID=G7W9K8_DESOD|nr:chromate transporter [Desulfosporosinus orientis]AET69925.1 chromate transport protein ChrA [Desulfosporosinus orientis DSM 765]